MVAVQGCTNYVGCNQMINIEKLKESACDPEQCVFSFQGQDS